MVIDLSKACTQTELADVVGVTQPAISAMMTERKIPSTGTLGELLHAYCQRLRDQAAGRLGSEIGGLDLVQERAALAREQRLGFEMKNAVARGEYAPISLLSEVLAIASQSVAERLDQLPSMLKKSCPDLTEAAREQVMTVVAAARNEWVRATEALVIARADADSDLDDDDSEIDADLPAFS
jgi:phage terminase Nu1 subunit (DNA packaging protein)